MHVPEGWLKVIRGPRPPSVQWPAAPPREPVPRGRWRQGPQQFRQPGSVHRSRAQQDFQVGICHGGRRRGRHSRENCFGGRTQESEGAGRHSTCVGTDRPHRKVHRTSKETAARRGVRSVGARVEGRVREGVDGGRRAPLETTNRFREATCSRPSCGCPSTPTACGAVAGTAPSADHLTNDHTADVGKSGRLVGRRRCKFEDSTHAFKGPRSAWVDVPQESGHEERFGGWRCEGHHASWKVVGERKCLECPNQQRRENGCATLFQVSDDEFTHRRRKREPQVSRTPLQCAESSALRDARYGLRAVRIGAEKNPGPTRRASRSRSASFRDGAQSPIVGLTRLASSDDEPLSDLQTPIAEFLTQQCSGSPAPVSLCPSWAPSSVLVQQGTLFLCIGGQRRQPGGDA